LTQIGRVEVGLNSELVTRSDIGKAERAALRAQARAVDRAEYARELDMVTRANAVYLQLRQAAGLSAGGAKTVDAWDSLMADVLRATPGDSKPAND
jgi:Spy/CpxP family protein refolding chaperone